MVVNVSFVPVAEADLILQQRFVPGVRLLVDIVVDEGGVPHRDHVIKAQKAKTAAIQTHDVFAGFDVGVVWLG